MCYCKRPCSTLWCSGSRGTSSHMYCRKLAGRRGLNTLPRMCLLDSTCKRCYCSLWRLEDTAFLSLGVLSGRSLSRRGRTCKCCLYQCKTNRCCCRYYQKHCSHMVMCRRPRRCCSGRSLILSRCKQMRLPSTDSSFLEGEWGSCLYSFPCRT
jgi:hypothetical protein